MAQQTLDFVIAQQVTGQRDVAKLIKQVGALDAEMKKLRAATKGLGSGFNNAAGKARGLTNPLDAQSRSLRQNRQGLQQVGMQVNDFATSVSTGGSVVTAFNQQIGQLGYALSLTNGRFQKVGMFLAGPWGAAVTVAAMGVGLLIEKFMSAGREAETLADKISSIKLASDQTSAAQSILSRVMDTTTGKMKNQTTAAKNHARAQLEVARIQARVRQQEARSALEEAAQRTTKVGTELAPSAFGAPDMTRIRFIRKPIVSAVEASRALKGETAEAIENLRRLNDEGKITDQRFAEVAAAADNFGVEAENIKILEEALESLSNQTPFGEGDTGGGNGGARKVAKDFGSAAAAAQNLLRQYEAGKISAQEFIDAQSRLSASLNLMELRSKGAGFAAQQLADYLTRVEERADKTSDSVKEFLAQGRDALELPQIKMPDQLVDAGIKSATEEWKQGTDAMEQAAQNVGRAVSNAFSGMLTGATSWKDGMMSIINAVIQELFRLFVVQQIVGMVKGVLGVPSGGASPSGSNSAVGAGLGLGARGGAAGATGGYPAPGRPVMVGERGPELFVPTGSGKIIPNHRMGGGSGMVINVDARGSTSPEQVRQQVELGILEAAPSIVAAAEQRTISTLRRPRLAGAL